MTLPLTARDTAAAGWNALIEDVTTGRWLDPDTGTSVTVPFRHIQIGDGFADNARDLVEQVMPAGSYAVVCDADTAEAMGAAVARLAPEGAVSPRFYPSVGLLIQHCPLASVGARCAGYR